jgi:polyhydroxybutyrate depolymerase
MNRSRALRFFSPAVLSMGVCAIGAYLCLAPYLRGVDRRSQAISVDGTARDYLLVTPRQMNKPLPLVVALHGIGDSPAGMAEHSGLDSLASKEAAIVVYPGAMRAMWRISESVPGNENRDIVFLDALVDQLSSQYRIDSRRIYAVGMSHGASFAQLWAAHRSTRISAVVAHSGDAPSAMAMPERAFPILLIVGSDDTEATVAAMRKAAETYRGKGQAVELTIVDHLGHEWAKARNTEIWEFLSRHRLED